MKTVEKLSRKRAHLVSGPTDMSARDSVVCDLVRLCSDRQVMTSLDVANAINIYDELLTQLSHEEKDEGA